MKSFNAVILGGGGTGKSSLTLRFMKEMFVDSYDPTIEESYRKQVKVDGELCNIEVLDTAGADQFTAVNEYYIRGSAGFILVFSLTQASSMRQVEALRQQIFRVKGLPIPNSISLDDFPLDGERTPSNGSSGHATPNGGHRSSSRRHQGGPRAKPSRSPLNIDSLSNARASDERSRSSGEDPNALMQDRYHHIPANREASTIPLVIVGTKSDLMGDREVSREMAIRMATLWGVPYYETSAKFDLNVDSVFMDILRQMKEHYPGGYKKLQPARREKKKKQKGQCLIQ